MSSLRGAWLQFPESHSGESSRVVENKWLVSCEYFFCSGFDHRTLIRCDKGSVFKSLEKDDFFFSVTLGWEWQVLPQGGVGVLLGTLSICGGCLFFHQRSTLYMVHSVGGLY